MGDNVSCTLEGLPVGYGWLFFKATETDPFFFYGGCNLSGDKGILVLQTLDKLGRNTLVHNAEEGLLPGCPS